jgi:adenylate kinase
LTAPAASPLHVVLLGPPASGKGTQGRRLAESLGLAYLSTGALLREQVESGTGLGKQAGPILERGEYLPDELMFPIISEWLARQSGGWILDGFPRSVPQAVFLTEWLAGHDRKLDAAVSLEVPIAELLERIQNRMECPQCRWSGQRRELATGDLCPACGHPADRRADDSEANFLSRHAEFTSTALPVIDYYRGRTPIVHCDATAPRDEVTRLLLAAFNARSA